MSEAAWIIVDCMLIMSFVWLTGSSVMAFIGKNLTREIVISYVSGIAICLALASALFSYAKICEDDEKQKMISSGRAILHGGVILLLSFMLNYYQMRAAGEHSNFMMIQLLLNYSRPFALAGGLLFAFLSALKLHSGFKLLIDSIFH